MRLFIGQRKSGGSGGGLLTQSITGAKDLTRVTPKKVNLPPVQCLCGVEHIFSVCEDDDGKIWLEHPHTCECGSLIIGIDDTAVGNILANMMIVIMFGFDRTPATQ